MALLTELLLLAYAAAVGFAAAGIVTSAYQLLSSEPARFRLFGEGSIAISVTFLFVLLAGPAIVARAAIAAGVERRHPPGLLLAGAAVVSAWSCCSGILMLGIGLGLRQGLG